MDVEQSGSHKRKAMESVQHSQGKKSQILHINENQGIVVKGFLSVIEGIELNSKLSLIDGLSNNDVNDFESGSQGQSMQGVTENRHNIVDRQHHPLQSETTSTQILFSRTNQEIADGGQKNVDGGQFRVEGAQSSVDSSHILQRFPKDACLYDGRLINLTDDIIKNLRNENTIPIGQGSFGKVYKSLHPSTDFGMHVVVKKIPLNDGQERTIRREMITSRILHPFILPLLAAVEQPLQDGKREFWFVSPLCSNGDLYNVLRDDRSSNMGLRLNAVKRVQILLQVALAIEYIHTAVPGVRAVILHKDIACKNIVLDDNYNARLIDFGLAREEDDDTTTAGGRPYYTHPHVGNEGARESWDYYSFGVIVREMISEFGPEGNGTKFLKNMTAEEVTVNKYIWGHDYLKNEVEKLNKMATYLLEQTDWKIQNFTKYIIQELKKIYTSLGHSCILDVSEGVNDQTCHSCMINKKAKQTSMIQMHNNNCYQKIEVCIACEKNSFLNPVTCYCGSKLSPTIGHRWGAILVAGNDTKDQYKVEVSKALAKDVKELKKLLTSHAPRIFGISENNIRTVVPSVQEELNVEEKLWPKVKDDFRYFSQTTDIDTLLIFFSCHGAQSSEAEESGDFEFQLGSSEDDSITLKQFEEELERLANIEKLIIILDRCYSPLVRFKKKDRVYVQINSCKQNQKAHIDNNGSIFTRFLISGLKAKSGGIICPDTCQHCNDYWNKSKDFISIHNLFDYIKGHLREQTPICKPNLYDHSSNIAFYTCTRVEIQFSHKSSSKNIPLDYLKDMEELNKKSKKEFGHEKEDCIRRDTFRKKKKTGELENDELCDILEKVMVAWVQRQRLEVTFK